MLVSFIFELIKREFYFIYPIMFLSNIEILECRSYNIAVMFLRGSDSVNAISNSGSNYYETEGSQ